ncbi:MAG: hypothetical protein IKB22_01610 [Lentisphaeria bacterium]|nr:hypothetical protein [Lentisphaeria bacterium]
MAEENMIKTLCSNCGTVYDLDSSLIGEYGECAECGSAFQIQDQTEYIIQALAAMEAAPAAEEAPAEEPVYTNTVKLTRVKSSGMIPQSLQDDSFKVGTINASTQSVIGTSRGNRKFTNARKFSSSSARRPAPPGCLRFLPSAHASFSLS